MSGQPSIAGPEDQQTRETGAGRSGPYRGFESHPLRQLVCCIYREILVSEIVAEYPGLKPGQVGANGLRDRILENDGPSWVPNSPLGSLAVRLALARPDDRPSGTILISLQTAASGFARCAGAARAVGRPPAPLGRLLAGGCLHDHWAASMTRAVSAASSICGQCPASSA